MAKNAQQLQQMLAPIWKFDGAWPIFKLVPINKLIICGFSYYSSQKTTVWKDLQT